MRYCVLFVLVAFVIVQAKLTPEDRLKKLEKHFDYLLEDNESLKSKVSELEEKIESKVQDDSHRSRRQLTNVAFTAYVSAWNLTNIGSHATIVFDGIISNLGFGYEPATGIFRAPTAGLYVFVIDLMVDPRGEADLHIMKSSGGGFAFDVSALYADGRFTNTYASSSRSVVLSLSSGDEVWVRNGFTTPIELHGNGFTTFSGWLLRQ